MRNFCKLTIKVCVSKSQKVKVVLPQKNIYHKADLMLYWVMLVACLRVLYYPWCSSPELNFSFILRHPGEWT